MDVLFAGTFPRLRWRMLRFILFCSLALIARAEPLEEWKPYAKTGLFPADSPWWLAPDMEKEPIATYTARLLDGARSADAKAMATLGRFFFVRGDADRAEEWLSKAARAGHGAAQLDYGLLRWRGVKTSADRSEAYAWLWLATWNGAPGAEDALKQASPKCEIREVLGGIQFAAKVQATQAKN